MKDPAEALADEFMMMLGWNEASTEIERKQYNMDRKRLLAIIRKHYPPSNPLVVKAIRRVRKAVSILKPPKRKRL